MSVNQEPAIRVRVDAANPGQFFACCGLLELADRLWKGVEGWFEKGMFCLCPLDRQEDRTLKSLLHEIGKTPLAQIDTGDDFSSPMGFPSPFALLIDWWKDESTGGNQLKVWAGSMRNVRIARSMQATLNQAVLHNEGLFDFGAVVYDPQDPDKKVEPFYFDARRGSNALAIDIGFMPDALTMTSVAYPAVEFLCLVGLQRFRPRPTDKKRIFDYFPWEVPLATQVAPLAACGLLPHARSRGYRFQIAFRTDQKKHKALTQAIPIERSET